jgi:hypothetical protein
MESRRNPYIYVSGAFGAFWVLMAWLNPENTYFMFPLLVAGAVPVSYRLALGRPLPTPVALGAAVAGLINVILLATLLALFGKLEGPTFLGAGGVVVETIVWGVLGATLGSVAARVTLRR